MASGKKPGLMTTHDGSMALGWNRLLRHSRESGNPVSEDV